MYSRTRHMVRMVLFAVLLVAGAGAGTVSSGTLAGQPEAAPATTGATPLAGTPVASDDELAWLQIGPGGVVIARAISSGSCPEITIDDVDSIMDIRAEPTGDDPVAVCETTLAVGTDSVSIGGTELRMPVDDAQRIMVIGDTGCRMVSESGYQQFQACNDPDAWPFGQLAEQGAAWQPDLVVHVGDYLYRESACPEGNEGCAGSPYGDNWETWHADFFDPAAPLLEAAPWVLMRGNHENCNRSGDGWFRYLDPRPRPTECQQFTDPYAFQLGDLQAVVMDAAAGGDTSSTPEVTEAFRGQFAEVEQLAGEGPAWLLTHRPFWSIADGDAGAYTEWTTATYTDAGYMQPPDAIELVLAGHVHMAQVLTFSEESGRPVELIAGNGGTLLESMETGVFTGSDVGDETLTEGWRFQEFGFVGLERTGVGWVATTPMRDGTVPLSCLVVEKSGACVG